MLATYAGTDAKSLISIEALKQAEDDAMAATVGLAPRARAAIPAPPAPVEETEEVADELQKQGNQVRNMLEGGGSARTRAP